MSLSEWMVPELSDSAALHLEHRKRVLRSEVKHSPESVADVACSLLQYTTMMEAIMRKATARIAELELILLLEGRSAGGACNSEDA